MRRAPQPHGRWVDTCGSEMEKLLGMIINAWCWVRIVVGLTVLGAALGAVAYCLIEGVAGVIAGASLAVLGLYFGFRLANHARRKGQLVEYAHGLPPTDASRDSSGWRTR